MTWFTRTAMLLGLSAATVCAQEAPPTPDRPAPTQEPAAKNEVKSDREDQVDLTLEVREADGLLKLLGSGNPGFVLVDATPEPQSKFWIGVGCEPATDALKSQLGLGEKPALLITMVADGSPAKAAGIQLHDVVSTAKLGDETKPLDSVATLTAMVVKAEQKQPLVLTVIRQSQPQEIAVTPAERPQSENHTDVSFVVADLHLDGPMNIVKHRHADFGNLHRVRLLLKELQAAVGEQPPTNDILVTGPVVAAPTPVTIPAPPSGIPHIVVMAKPELPENVTVTITKKGKEPIRVQYQEGEGKVWGATEDELATLPEAGRNAVQQAIRWLQQKGQPADGRLWGAPPHAGFSGNWPVPYVFTNKAESVNNSATANTPPATARIRKTVTAPATPATAQDATTRLQALEKRLELVQKQQQELITKQQETLKKELQAVREALEKAEKK